MLKFNLDSYLRHYFPEAKVSGDERYMKCFYCGKPWKLYVNVAKQRFYCFRCGAGEGASIVDFVRDHLGVSLGEAWRIIRSRGYLGRKPLSYAGLFERAQRPTRETVLPKEYIPIYPLEGHKGSLFGQKAVSYLRGRGLTDADVLYYRIGYCTEGRYAFRIIIPVVAESEIVYFMARLFFGPGPRYLNPEKNEVTANPANLLFNWDTAKQAKVLKLTEGVFDGMALGDWATSFFGKQIHEGQWALLHSGVFDEMEVWLDPDARQEAEDYSRQLRAAFDVPVTLCRLAWGDPGQLKTESIPVARDSGDSLQSYFEHRFSVTIT